MITSWKHTFRKVIKCNQLLYFYKVIEKLLYILSRATLICNLLHFQSNLPNTDSILYNMMDSGMICLLLQYCVDYTPGDVFGCVADIGWITGHSYVVYGPLCNGATSVLFESTTCLPPIQVNIKRNDQY